jgi:hypothetical protein
MRNQALNGYNQTRNGQLKNGRLLAFDGVSKQPEKHQRGLWSFLTWSFFLSQAVAADRVLASIKASDQEDGESAAAARSKADSGTPAPDLVDGAQSRTSTSAEAIGDEGLRIAKSSAVGKTAMLLDNAGRASPAPASKPSTNEVGDSADGGGGGGGGDAGGDGGDGDNGSGCGKPGSGCSLGSGPSQDAGSPIGSPPILGGPTPPGGPNSGGNGVSAAVDVNVGGSPIGIDAGLVDLGVHAQVSIADLLGFDLGLSPDGIFVAAEIELDRLPNLDQLALNPVHVVETTTRLELDHLLKSDLPGIDVLLGSGEHLSHIKAALAEVTGLSLVEAPGALIDQLGGSDAIVPATLARTTDALSSARPLPIQVAAELAGFASHAGSGDLSSGGVIIFPAPAGKDVLPINELFADGRYTDYNLALQSAVASSTATVSDPTGSAPVAPSVPTSSLEEIVSPDRHDPGKLPLAPTPVEFAAALEDSSERGLSL